jgi:hypothetical protein
LFEAEERPLKVDDSQHKERPKPVERDKPSRTHTKEVRTGFKILDRSPFHKHLWIYGGVIGFLFIINALTWQGTIWFHWPALGWGLLLFLHWVNVIKKDEQKDKSKIRLYKHLSTYLGVIGFLFIINMLTWRGTIWFHWPALGWGLFIFLHWLQSSKFSSKRQP